MSSNNATNRESNEGWIDLTREEIINSNPFPSNNLTYIDPAALESIMGDLLDLTTSEKNSIVNRSGNGRSTTDYSRISTPIVKSVSSNSSEKNGNNDKDVNGSELLWYWNSRPEINNMYNCSKWVDGSNPLLETPLVNQGYLISPTISSSSQDGVGGGPIKFVYSTEVNFREWLKQYLPSLLLTHACTFILGAATMYFILRRCVQIQTTHKHF